MNRKSEEDIKDGLAKIAQTSIFYNAILLYNQMMSVAKLTTVTDLISLGFPLEAGGEVWIYHGYLQDAGAEVGLSRGKAVDATRLLTAMRAITPLKRANRTAGSIIMLSYRPTQDQFNAYKLSLGGMDRRISPSRYDSMKDEIADLRQRVVELERKQIAVENNNAAMRLALDNLGNAFTKFMDEYTLGGK